MTRLAALRTTWWSGTPTLALPAMLLVGLIIKLTSWALLVRSLGAVLAWSSAIMEAGLRMLMPPVRTRRMAWLGCVALALAGLVHDS